MLTISQLGVSFIGPSESFDSHNDRLILIANVISRTFEMDAFCVENTWDEWDSAALVYNEHSQDEEALTLTCDMCKEEVNIILW